MANLKEAFEYAAQNPTSDFANNLKALAGSGSLDQEAKKYGIDLTPFKPKVEQTSQMSRLGTDLLNRAKTVGEQVKQVGQAEGVTETAAQVAQTPLRVVGQAAGAVGDVIGAGINAATGGGLDKLGEYIASTETGKQLGASLLKLQQEQPELAQGLGDLFNIASLVPVGAAAKPVAKAIGTGARNAINATSDIVKYVPDNLGQKAVDLISSDPSAKVETILKRSTPEEVDNFLKIAAQSSVSGESKSVFETVGDKLFDTTKVLQTKLSEIGKAKSDIMQPLREGFGAFKKETTPFIQKLNSLKNSFTEIDAASKAKVQAIINDAKNVVTKQDADVLIDKVQDALYKGGIDMTIPKGSALDKQLRGILGEYNTALKNSLPKEYGQLNARYAQLIDSLDTINRSLGEVVEGVPVRGASLIKQYFSPSGSKAKEIFEFIKNETNGQVDLAKDATLAKFAGELYDDANVSSLLGGLKSVPTTVGGIATKLVEKLGSGRVTEAMRASTVRKAKGKTTPQVESKVSPSKSNGLSVESQKQLQDMLSKAPEAKTHIDSIAKDIADSTGNGFGAGQLKTLQSATRKAVDEENGMVENLKDLARNTIILRNAGSYNTVLKNLGEKLDVVRTKVQKLNSGYEGTIVNVKAPNGLISEIQVVKPKILYGKDEKMARSILGDAEMARIEKETGVKAGLGHSLYEKYRVLSPVEQISKQGKKLLKESFDYYSKLK